MKGPSANYAILGFMTAAALYFYLQVKGGVSSALSAAGSAASAAGGAFEGAIGIPAAQQPVVNSRVGGAIASGNVGSLWNDLSASWSNLFSSNSTGSSKAQIISQAETVIQAQEGEKQYTYLDSLGVLTGGIGHKILPSDGYTAAGQYIPQSTIDAWFSSDVSAAYYAAISQANQLNQATNDLFVVALVSVNYQLGTSWPQEFPTLWSYLLAGNGSAAVADISNTAWYQETPSRAQYFQNAITQAMG